MRIVVGISPEDYPGGEGRPLQASPCEELNPALLFLAAATTTRLRNWWVTSLQRVHPPPWYGGAQLQAWCAPG